MFNLDFFWSNLFTPKAPFLRGLGVTIAVSVVSEAGALLLGLGIALLRRSKHRPLNLFAQLYIWVIRGTPLLVQLVLVYTGFAAAGIFYFRDAYLLGIYLTGALQAALVTLIVNESAYVSEIIRAGLESVPRGQYEASQSLGMTPVHAMARIVLPQALRTMVPPLGNSFNGLMKSTSILSVIGVSEMFLVAQQISSATFRTFEIFIVVGLYYLALTTAWTFIQAAIEKRLNVMVGLAQPVSLKERLAASPLGRLIARTRRAPVTPVSPDVVPATVAPPAGPAGPASPEPVAAAPTPETTLVSQP
jgi:polar amino acid transport system permease protein